VTVGYRWTCKLCGASNAPAEACSKCNCPAEVTADEIDLARSAGSFEAVIHKRENARRARAEWFAQPLWQKTVDVAAFALFIVGLALGKFAGPIVYNVLRIALALAGGVLIWITHGTLFERK